MSYSIKSIREEFKKNGIFYTPPELIDFMYKYIPSNLNPLSVCTCQQKLDTKLKKSGIKNESMYKIHQLF